MARGVEIYAQTEVTGIIAENGRLKGVEIDRGPNTATGPCRRWRDRARSSPGSPASACRSAPFRCRPSLSPPLKPFLDQIVVCTSTSLHLHLADTARRAGDGRRRRSGTTTSASIRQSRTGFESLELGSRRDLIAVPNPCKIVHRNKEVARRRYATDEEYQLVYGLALTKTISGGISAVPSDTPAGLPGIFGEPLVALQLVAPLACPRANRRPPLEVCLLMV